jgi:hypothetical protein
LQDEGPAGLTACEEEVLGLFAAERGLVGGYEPV